jgi:hypothetical protein
VYDQLLILNPDFSLNRTAYEIYGPPWQSGSQVVFLFGSAIVTPFRLILSLIMVYAQYQFVDRRDDRAHQSLAWQGGFW